MSVMLINGDDLTAIADAIRSKLSTSRRYKPSEMPSAIRGISGGGVSDRVNFEYIGRYNCSRLNVEDGWIDTNLSSERKYRWIFAEYNSSIGAGTTSKKKNNACAYFEPPRAIQRNDGKIYIHSGVYKAICTTSNASNYELNVDDLSGTINLYGVYDDAGGYNYSFEEYTPTDTGVKTFDDCEAVFEVPDLLFETISGTYCYAYIMPFCHDSVSADFNKVKGHYGYSKSGSSSASYSYHYKKMMMLKILKE